MALAITYALGISSLMSIGLLIASVFSSSEFVSGLINMLSWPMMFLWPPGLSLEGSPAWIKSIAAYVPLSPLVKAARSIMIDGATWQQVLPQWIAMIVTTIWLITFSAYYFKWERD